MRMRPCPGGEILKRREHGGCAEGAEKGEDSAFMEAHPKRMRCWEALLTAG